MHARFRGLSKEEIAAAVVAILGVDAVGAAPAALFEADNSWIDRPWFFPPDIAFPVVWTPVFFGLQCPDLGLVVIGALLLAIAATILAFDRISRLAAGLLVPYLAWVSFAFVLNFTIYTGVG